ncbi:MAG TPA: hypothetical protein PKW33_04130 [Anaerolineaceae bacterium]|nr:hypothetical protein [Anaerolineaceae bacterium]HPN50750.1 hypothetical protein [Anaerolineaceae bacterium]
MATMEERLKILTMIQEGKITAEDGARLIEALEDVPVRPQRPARPDMPPMPPLPPNAPNFGGKGPRWFRVRVTDTDSGKTRVNVRLPVSLLNAGVKMGAKFSPEVEGLDLNQLMELVQAGEIGQIVDVYDDEDGEHVEVFLE